jgi:hypothetical protein
VADGGWENVLRSDLDDAGFVGPQGRQQYSEIQVVSEYDPAVYSCEIEDLGIWRARLANFRPVDCLEAMAGQKGNP